MAINMELLDKLYKNDLLVELEDLSKVPRIASPSPSMDWMLQGGIVPGRFYCLYGAESSGKSMYAMSVCSKILKKDPDSVIIWFDTEESCTRHWVDIFMPDSEGFTEFDRTKRLIPLAAKYGREIFDYYLEKVALYCSQGLKVACCVIDSIQSIVPPKIEKRESTEKAQIAPLAGYLSDAMKMIIRPSRKYKTTWLFISQARQNMDPIEQIMGNKYRVSAGNAFMHYIDALLLFEQLRGKAHKVFDENLNDLSGNKLHIGNEIKVKIHGKCRVGMPNRIAIFKFLYEKGFIDTHKEIGELALKLGISKLDGKTYFFGDEKLGVGIDDYYNAILGNEELKNRIFEEVMKVS